MKSLNQSAIRVCQPGVSSLSRRSRQAIRFAMAVACVVAIFLFLFFPEYAPWVVYPIPAAATLFVVLTIFESLLRSFTRFRRRRRMKGQRVGKLRSRRRYGAAKRLAGLAVAVLLVDVVLYDTVYGSFYGSLTVQGIQPIPIAAAVLLLLAIVNESSVFGFFVCDAEMDRLSRLQRQTYFSMLSAIDGGSYQPLTSNEIELEEEAELDDYQIVAFSAATESEDEWLREGQDDWEDDIECDAATVSGGSASAGSLASGGLARRVPR